jgi:hypothetical protein
MKSCSHRRPHIAKTEALKKRTSETAEFLLATPAPKNPQSALIGPHIASVGDLSGEE